MEAAMPSVGLVEMEDAETGSRVLVDSSTVSGKMAVDARIRALRALGLRASAVGTQQDPYQHLLQHFRRLEQSR
jgi:hypothetical protein